MDDVVGAPRNENDQLVDSMAARRIAIVLLIFLSFPRLFDNARYRCLCYCPFFRRSRLQAARVNGIVVSC